MEEKREMVTGVGGKRGEGRKGKGKKDGVGKRGG